MCREYNSINHDLHETNWADILIEELSEAIEEAQKRKAGSSVDDEELLNEVIQLGALCVAWAGCIMERTVTNVQTN